MQQGHKGKIALIFTSKTSIWKMPDIIIVKIAVNLCLFRLKLGQDD